ncbi:MAG: hypothetical protein CMM58_09360 [Rhodospirillaceae bacterium]|mgnify:CR=1 FL=1|nr:hypothetical protein [Rhodospirillaceae bacterium]
MDLKVRNGSSIDDLQCGLIMLSTTEVYNIPNWLTEPDGSIKDPPKLPLGGNLRLLASVDNEPAGFADYSIAKCHIKFLFVKPQFQGLGIGTILLNDVLNRLDSSVTVNVLCINEPAVLWYLARGFRAVSAWEEPLQGRKTAWLKMSTSSS